MDTNPLAIPRRTDTAPAASRVLIAVPFYKNEHLVAPLLGSIIASAGDIAAIGGEVLLYVDSPDYAPLVASLQAALPQVQAVCPCQLLINTENLGFVRTMNQAVAQAVARRCDLLLLNSDTQMEPGALAEMARVLRLDHMTGFVNPRSNNATIATLPLRHVPADTKAARAAYAALAAMLPATSYVPTAVGFCLLIAWRVLAEFGGFDEIYGKGYNEENDLVMRAGRCGFRAVLANHAFVWHEGETSFSTASTDRSVWEPANRAILDARYPEYAGFTLSHYDAPETLAEHSLATLLPDAEGKRDLAFDFSSFRAAHNGTFQAGRQLLEMANRVWGDTYKIWVLCGEEVYAFHDYTALGVARADPHAGQRFAAIFRVGQPYDWNVLQRLVLSGAAIGVYMLDTISVDCPQLTSNFLYSMWQFTLDHVDLLVTQSHQTQSQFALRFTMPADAAQAVCLHSADLADYQLPHTGTANATADGPILILGNHFAHKYLSPTANALAVAFPDRKIVALGAPSPDAPPMPVQLTIPALSDAPNLVGVPVGKLSDAEIGSHYAACSVVVFPSHAEGFGFPALNALAARRPLFVRRIPVFEELWQLLRCTPNMHFYDTTAELVAMLATPPAWIDLPVQSPVNDSERAARQIKAALDGAMAHANYQRIVRRIRAVQLTAGAQPGVAPETDAGRAAQFAASRIEAVLRRLLGTPAIYAMMRLSFRGLRGIKGFFKR